MSREARVPTTKEVALMLGITAFAAAAAARVGTPAAAARVRRARAAAASSVAGRLYQGSSR
ncbi:hypothetical protein [Rhodococcus chondri]|uniref:Uncharacterized protein n=1 Tax=Rhodococcus chondri TaxID=3065941 RepID=A0ABU7JMH6_9NOCA|nr:hypothetical protein [Rhodococcus sp. CC-R104]MEE2031235.1 hypothetical protein [Rhodococcus sp. CC-R104]